MTAETIATPQETAPNLWERVAPGLKDFFVHGLGQVRIFKKVYGGIMHFLIFWGVTVQVIGTAINLQQMDLFIPFLELPFPRGNGYFFYELMMDLAGGAIIVGILMAIFRRVVTRPKSLETRWDDVYALTMLMLIPIAGFTLEGARLLTVAPDWARWSPIGNIVAGLYRAAGLTPEQLFPIHSAFLYIHMGLALILVASIPYTKFRHMVMGPWNIIMRWRRKEGTLAFIPNIDETEELGAGQIAEFKTAQLRSFDACVNCGRCEAVCPADASGMAYSPRVLIQTLRANMVDTFITKNGASAKALIGEILPDEMLWSCTMCGACIEACPLFINPVDQITDLRRNQVLMTGQMPKSVGDTLRNFERQGNPWGMPGEDRMAWAEGLDIREIAPGEETDVLLFMGCAASYDERNKKVSRAFVKLLQDANVEFATLGFDEVCCGETARRMGHEYLFQVFAEQNIEAFSNVKFNKIVTQCPHCFNTLKNEYPQMGGDFEVLHYTELLNDLKLDTSPTKLDKKVAYHDPCYLGRINGVFDAPRELMSGVNGNRKELPLSKADSFCCGGGGGGMWMETDADKRINNKRLSQAQDAGVEVIATACPYCMLMFDDAIRSQGLGDRIQVLDIAEILTKE